MKAILFFLVTASALSASAWGLDSHYGRVTNYGNEYTCTWNNSKNRTMDMKYVVFIAERMSGESAPEEVQIRIDRKVRPGDAIESSTDIVGAYMVHNCKFLSRN